ncbi:MAG: type II secretion system protein [Planctomycetes bacterium]|nr:type II secretion system protein [Planctomycetota bacterium]
MTTHHRASFPHAIRNRAGYTLIEVMVVMAIIATISSLGAWGANRAYNSMVQRGVIVELEGISQSLEKYRTENKLYPPCMGANPDATITGAALQMGLKGRETMFDLHIRSRWTRATQINYNTLQQYLTIGAAPYNYNYKSPSGGTAKLNLNTMDQAEALVFWLGGFPSPVDASGVPYSSNRLIGFHRDDRNPFRLNVKPATPSALVENRSPAGEYFLFDQTRLQDVDGDGWLEYRPAMTQGDGTAAAPPIVYFDSGTYSTTRSQSGLVTFTSYPPLGNQHPFSPALGGLAAQWGIAMPYAVEVESNGAIIWQRSQSYQLIAAGFDGCYSKPAASKLYIPEFPSGEQFNSAGSGGFTQQGFVDAEGEDNLTSFVPSKLGDSFINR